MRPLLLAAATLVLLSPHAPVAAQSPASTVETDPPRDTLHPAHSEILHIPSGGVKINGLAYLAAGAGTHPTFAPARTAWQREEPRSRAGGAPPRVERDHVQLSRIVGEPGRVSIRQRARGRERGARVCA